jgi:acyl-CoA synthetase (AMP-forming)/AMP-acid ligase II
MISHRTILADAENLIEGQLFSPELVFIINGPLNHIGSLSKLFPVIMLGATLYIIEGMKDINRFFQALDYPAEKMATFFVPANVRILTQFSADRLAAYADKIDFIECGGAPLAHADMLELCRLLPKTRLYNTYASTETGIISTYNYNDGRCMPGCLGRPMSHSRIIITPEGRISCQGDTLMSGYIGDPELTATVLRNDTIYMSDLGLIDEEGMLHIGGREDDVINVGGFKVAPTEVEDAAMAMSEVKDCICIATPHPITGLALKLLVVMAEGQLLDKKRLARFLKSQLEEYKVPLLYQQVDAIRRTYNGKLDRKAYRNP